MADLLLSGGDLVANVFGDLELCFSNNDISQSVNNLIKLKIGNNIYHTDIGNGIYDIRIKSSEDGIDTVVEESKIAMMQDPRVGNIKSINVTVLNIASCRIDYILVTKNGVEVDGSVEIGVQIGGGTE